MQSAASRPAVNTRDQVLSAAWGAAEATCFFIVPDVWITRVALRSPKGAFAAAGSALLGAVLGGVATYAWGKRTSRAQSNRLLRKLPAISGAMIDKAEDEMVKVGNRGMLWGPLRGVPYKIYARTAGMQGQSFAGFLAWSIPARIPRFLLVAAATVGLAAGARRFVSPTTLDKLTPSIHTIFWIAFYSWYLRVVGRERPAESTELGTQTE